jgi:hypothetical protein
MKPHEHKARRTVEVCACGAQRQPDGEWIDPAAQALVRRYLDNSTPEERSANARKANQKRWRGRKNDQREYMREIASRPRPNRVIPDRCPCGLYSRELAERRGHKCHPGKPHEHKPVS